MLRGVLAWKALVKPPAAMREEADADGQGGAELPVKASEASSTRSRVGRPGPRWPVG